MNTYSTEKYGVVPVIAVALLITCISFICLMSLPGLAEAQVSITVGVQEVYDDNVFLENDSRRPAFIAADDAIEESVLEGQVPTVLSDEQDGENNDDLITNLTFSLATTAPLLQRYATTKVQGTVGFILFSEFDSQNRLTLDGVIDTELSKDLLPDPFYAQVSNQFLSNSNDASVSQGTSSRTTQIYSLIGRTGVRGINLAPRTTLNAGYTGSLNLFLGEFLLGDRQPGEIEEQGSDFHSHTLTAEFSHQASQNLVTTLTFDAGTQLFTNVETNDADGIGIRDEDDLDRTTYSARLGARYTASQALSFGGYAGWEISEFNNDAEPFEVTVIGEDGTPESVLREREDSQSNFIFGADASYQFAPGSVALVGIEQDSGIDIDGDRITTRSIFANSSYTFNDRFSMNIGGRFFQFATADTLSNSIDRFEASASLNYAVTQQASIVLGYNYSDQDASSAGEQGQALFGRSQSYEVNRVFLGINVGLVGLPLS